MGVDILVIGAAGRLGRAVTQAFERMAPDFTLAASKHEALDASGRNENLTLFEENYSSWRPRER